MQLLNKYLMSEAKQSMDVCLFRKICCIFLFSREGIEFHSQLCNSHVDHLTIPLLFTISRNTLSLVYTEN